MRKTPTVSEINGEGGDEWEVDDELVEELTEEGWLHEIDNAIGPLPFRLVRCEQSAPTNPPFACGDEEQEEIGGPDSVTIGYRCHLSETGETYGFQLSIPRSTSPGTAGALARSAMNSVKNTIADDLGESSSHAFDYS